MIKYLPKISLFRVKILSPKPKATVLTKTTTTANKRLDEEVKNAFEVIIEIPIMKVGKRKYAGTLVNEEARARISTFLRIQIGPGEPSSYSVIRLLGS